jgi:aspartate/methionine/tyrosine aminotransferase
MTAHDLPHIAKARTNPGGFAVSRRSGIDPFVVMDVMREANARQAAGDDIIHMEVGQPGTPAPRIVREAAKRAIDTGTLGYTDALGLPELRERIAAFYGVRYGVSVSPSRIVVTTGSSAGFVLAFLALLNAGDALLIPSPGYPCYRQIARVLDIAPVSVRADAATRFMPSADAVREAAAANPHARALLLASPANPTGAACDQQTFHALMAAAEAAGLWFLSDEIYHGLTYAMQETTAVALSENAIVINSFSKYFSMTGWRVGWMVVPEGLVRVVERLAQNLYISVPAISQVAAVAAFDATDELEAYKATYARNRAMLLEELPRAGFTALAPADGAFYLYADISRFTSDSAAFVKRMLAETGVAATPGIDFDPLHGNRFLRFSYAGTFKHMREAARRLQAWKK